MKIVEFCLWECGNKQRPPKCKQMETVCLELALVKESSAMTCIWQRPWGRQSGRASAYALLGGCWHWETGGRLSWRETFNLMFDCFCFILETSREKCQKESLGEGTNWPCLTPKCSSLYLFVPSVSQTQPCVICPSALLLIWRILNRLALIAWRANAQQMSDEKA